MSEFGPPPPPSVVILFPGDRLERWETMSIMIVVLRGKEVNTTTSDVTLLKTNFSSVSDRRTNERSVDHHPQPATIDGVRQLASFSNDWRTERQIVAASGHLLPRVPAGHLLVHWRAPSLNCMSNCLRLLADILRWRGGRGHDRQIDRPGPGPGPARLGSPAPVVAY